MYNLILIDYFVGIESISRLFFLNKIIYFLLTLQQSLYILIKIYCLEVIHFQLSSKGKLLDLY